MIDLTTITMQIIGSNPDGIKLCRVNGSTLLTVVIPRNLLGEAKRLPDIPKRGVYYLLDDNKGRLRRVYAGQTVAGIGRLDSHSSCKEWWNKAVMFLAPDNEFSMDIISGLESVAIEYIRSHGAYEVDNLDDPRPYISPYSESFINALHEDILFRMTVLGFDLDAVGDDCGMDFDGVFHTVKNGVRASGIYNAEKGTFEVLSGSYIDMKRPTGGKKGPNKTVEGMRRRCVDAGDLVEAGDGLWQLGREVPFDTPSAAAVFVLGGSQNGWTEWVSGDGRTLSAVYRKADREEAGASGKA